MEYSYRSTRPLALRIVATLIMMMSSLLLLARPPATGAAAVILVTTAADVVGADGECSLREAIIAANTNTGSDGSDGECVAGEADEPDEIFFADDSITITLASELPAVTSAMTITGNGPDNTIIQAQVCNPVTLEPENCTPAQRRVLSVTAGGDLTLEGVTVRHGYLRNVHGGAINNNQGNLTVTDSVFSGNKISTTGSTYAGGAIYSHGGELTVSDSVFTGNMGVLGGAISSNSVLEVTGSTFSENTSIINGGAIIIGGVTAKVTDSTFNSNTASGAGGAISSAVAMEVNNSTFYNNSAGVNGGAINIFFIGRATITNSTFSKNKAPNNNGGAIHSNGVTADMWVVNNTFFDNDAAAGSAIYRHDGTLTLANSFLVSDSAVAICDGSPDVGTSVNAGGNLSDDDSCSGTATSNLTLLPLADNGGPTQTHGLPPGSPAIDGGDDDLAVDGEGDPLSTDQRGFDRISGEFVDVGAVEMQTAQLTIAKTTDPGGGEGFPFTVDPVGLSFLENWGEYGNLGGQYYDPSDVAFDPDGNVYVADASNHRVQKLNSDGEFLLAFGWDVVDNGDGNTGYEVCTVVADCLRGDGGSGAGQFNRPSGVAVDAAGNIYVVDRFNHYVQKFDSDGEILAAFGSDVMDLCEIDEIACLSSSTRGIAVDAAGNVYVSDFLTHRVLKFDDSGAFVMAWGKDVVDGGGDVCTVAADCQAGAPGSGAGHFNSPVGVAVDAAGDVYVADSGNQRVQKFSGDGTFLLTFGRDVIGGNREIGFEICTVAADCKNGIAGVGAGQFQEIVSIGVDAAGNVYVTDRSTNRAQKFAGDGTFLMAFGKDTVAGNDVTGFEVCLPGDTCQGSDPGDEPGQMSNPTGVAVDAAGVIYVANVGSARIQLYGPEAAFTLDDGQSEVFTLMPGGYHISELVPDGWELESIDCNGGDPDYLGATATVTLDEGSNVTCTFHNEEIAEPCPDVDGNLITNPCFEDGSAPWTFYSDGHGTYDVSPTNPGQGDGSAEIGITEPGSNVQFYQSGIQLKGGTGYELSFVARSNNGQDMSVYVHQHGAPFASYGLANFHVNLTDTWESYSITFTTPNIGNVSDGRLRFWLAPYSTTGDVYYIDHVVLRETADAPPVEPPPPPPPLPELGHCDSPVPGNVLLNPGFEAQKNSWKFANDGVMTFTTPAKPNTTPFECQRNARIQITTQGNSVQLYQTGFTLLPDTDYYLRFAGRSSNGRNASLFLHQHSAPYTNYGLNGTVVDLTTSWQVFELHFKTNATFSETTDTRLRFWLSPFDADGMTYEFDDVVLMPQAADPVRATIAETATSATSLVSGYYIDAAHPDRLAGGYVGEVAGCRAARVGLSRLWPANNKMKAVTITNVGTPQTLTILGVWQDEPVGPEPDAIIGSDGVVYLRAERDLDAGADGRVYTIQFRATYANGQSCDYVATVGVPLTNGRGMEAVNGGGLFGSLTE